MTYFIGRCMWDSRRVYLRWVKERERIAQLEAALLDPEAFFRLLTALPHHGEPETILFSGSFMELLAAQPAETRAVVRLTCDGYADGEIAERLKSTPGAVRTRRYRFKKVLYQAASEREDLDPRAAARQRRPRAAAERRMNSMTSYSCSSLWPCSAWRLSWRV
ncbi:hypothetical protein ACGF8D_25960 [Streptomyces massasporeus]|uniref:hypothetical protein n=1 Tax=Streptomyces massasporeus TaxID=67324 RepID=UPI00371063B7